MALRGLGPISGPLSFLMRETMLPEGQATARPSSWCAGASVGHHHRVEYRHDESQDDKGLPADQGKKTLAGQDIIGFEATYLFN